MIDANRVIAISGKQGSGKSTLADQLCEKHYFKNPVRLKFANVLYALHDACLPVLKEFGVRPDDMEKDGELLQVLGTEYGRKRLGEDVWVKATVKAIEHIQKDASAVVIIDDMRFQNELLAFAECTTVRLNCDRNARKERCSYWRTDENHASETGLDGAAVFALCFDTSKAKSQDIAAAVFNEVVRRERHV